MSRHVLALALLTLSSCTVERALDTPRSMVFTPHGEFVDDYGIRYTIGPYTWRQHGETPHAGATYHVTDWNVERQAAIAQNDANNPTDSGLWTRIDWVRLDGADGYTWAFCYAVFDAASRHEAITAPPTQRDTPRTGCNGYPFSRMRRQ